MADSRAGALCFVLASSLRVRIVMTLHTLDALTVVALGLCTVATKLAHPAIEGTKYSRSVKTECYEDGNEMRCPRRTIDRRRH